MIMVISALAVPHIHRKKGADKPQHKDLQTDLESIERLVQESTELENGLRNLELNLTEYREQVGNLTEGEQAALVQMQSSLRNAQRRLTLDRIREESQRHRENFENAIRQLQATIDEQERNVQEHRARQIEEFRRVNEQILRARQTLSEEGN
ncbi:hypothetical protein ACROYT_G025844 [Oculina patagonica]